MQETDRRVRRTRAALGQALLDLAAERPFEALTVREIVDRADVGDATFFRHYASKEARLRLLFAAQRGTAVEREVRAAVEARVLASRGFRPPADVPADLAAHHLAAASLALVAWWLEHGMPYRSEKMGQIYARLVVGPVGGG